MSQRPRGAAGPILVFGLAASVALWLAWFTLNLPGLHPPAPLSGGVFLLILALGGFAAARGAEARPLLVAGGSGLVAALFTLAPFLALIVEPPKPGASAPAPGLEGAKPAVFLFVAGFLALSTVVAIIGGLAGRRAARPQPDPKPPLAWLARFSFLVAVSMVPLLLLGAHVTSTRSGLAVPDWPGTYGANMFLYPIALMADPRVFLEHSHRLFGTLVGLATLTQLIWVLRRGPLSAKIWSASLFAAVCLQGLAGGTRVTEQSQVLAMVHGILAQAVFAAAIVLALLLTRLWREPEFAPYVRGDRRRRIFSTGLLHAILFQLVLGAAYRHLLHLHILWSHAAFSIVVVIFALLAGFLATHRHKGPTPVERMLPRYGWTVVSLAGVQFLLGWAAFWVVLTTRNAPVPTADELGRTPTAEAWPSLIRTAHHANGAALLAAATFGAVAVKRLRKPPHPAPK